ncbi:MAG: hypothetical protein HOF23_04420, partial [Rhodospirillaceae bacterium]|nr:hypothetical protein [Rhodospirillaceae bacterium]
MANETPKSGQVIEQVVWMGSDLDRTERPEDSSGPPSPSPAPAQPDSPPLQTPSPAPEIDPELSPASGVASKDQ